MRRRPPRSTLFPYPTFFRSIITSCSRKCRNSSRRLSAGVSRCEELAPGPKAPGTLENKGQPSAQAARGFHQHHLLAAHHAKRKIALRQHVAKVGRGFHAPRSEE